MMIRCDYLIDDSCGLASSLAKTKVLTNSQVCEFCLKCDNPKSLNKAVASIACSELLKSGRFDVKDPDHATMKELLTVEPFGPGTELKKMIDWFPVPGKKGCQTCRNLAFKMDKWGPEKCTQKMDYILRKLEIAAKRRSIPFVRFAVQKLVEAAIRKGSAT